ncbi:MAG: hypothetical protein WA816_13125 [Bacteroidales bacterium]
MNFIYLIDDAIDWNKTGVWVAIIALALGFIGIVFKAGGIKKTIDIVEKDVGEIKTTLQDFSVRFAITESRVADLWTPRTTIQNSPKYLNDYGNKILKESKINELINEHYEEILKNVKDLNPGNSYQAEQDIIKVVNRLILDPICQNKLEISAFQTGQSVSTILYVGSIYIRDKIIKEIGLDVSDIDKHDPGKLAQKS